MLVLSRHRDEEIMINHDISIKIVDIRGDKVRLGIVAPKDVSVHRREVYDAIYKKKEQEVIPKPITLEGMSQREGPGPQKGPISVEKALKDNE